MLGAPVQQPGCPFPALGQLITERFHPERLNQKKIQPPLGATLLHAVNEEVIRVQLVRHHQVIPSRHTTHYSGRTLRLSILSCVSGQAPGDLFIGSTESPSRPDSLSIDENPS